ncbi:MBOAT family O-acyltransferase [Brevibacillus dissolubilis]|uniref:MBOAT family O-acyltransferase n=1 Tax=Brevibacillus dissolubilis TaxID=1844116 RepID=UPI00159BDF26|nr:MBOAT family protein [Brevibacillus dissolubilis]
MIFNTWVYAAFSLLTLLIYWFAVPSRYRAHVLLFASYLFFTYHFPWHTLLILVMTVVVYTLSLKIFEYKPRADQGEKLPWHQNPKFYLTAIILFSVAILAYYKYLKMAVSTLNEIFALIDYEKAFALPEMVVPLGLSFFVFEFIHYAVDVYHGHAKKTGPFQFALFIMYFPTLVSGPIKRYTPFNDQTVEMGTFRKEYLYEGLYRILIGLFKKVVIADQMTPYANYMLTPATATTWDLWIAMYAYAIKIFFDFSGYSDIAIGSARLFGYRVPENFNYPYLQRNVAEFWNNWHMSLSSWIRDYVYIPLGGNRGSVAFAARNSLIAMSVSGLWHGAAWHFVFWGFYHGMGIAIVRFYTVWKKKRNPEPFPKPVTKKSDKMGPPRIESLGQVFAILLTFHFVAFGWIFFYCDFSTAIHVIYKMFMGA